MQTGNNAGDTGGGSSTNDRVISVASSAGASVGATVGSMLGKALDARILMVSSNSNDEEFGVSSDFDFPVASILGTSMGAALGSSVGSCLRKRIVVFMKATDRKSSNGLQVSVTMTRTAREANQHQNPIPGVIPGTPSSTSSSPQRKRDSTMCPSCGKSLSPLTSTRKIAMRKPNRSGAIRRVLPPRKHTRRKRTLGLTRAGRIATVLAVSGLYNNNVNIEDKLCVSTMKRAEPQGVLPAEMRRPVLFAFKSKPVHVVWRKAVSKMIIESMPFVHVPPSPPVDLHSRSS